MRYFFHPESDSLWMQADSTEVGGDGLIEELTEAEYYQRKVQNPKFRKWLVELDATAKRLDPSCPESLSKQTGEESWVDFFDDNYTPEDAIREDWSNV